MAEDKIEIIPMGKSPVHEAMEWLVMYELLCKQVASAFGVPPELLTPSNTACTRSAKVEAQKGKPKSKKVAKPARG